MYIVEDRLGPTIGRFVENSKFKNLFLKHWPTTIDVGGTEVFDRLYVYRAAAPHRGIVKTPETLAIYKIIGTNTEELESEDYDGVEDMWFTLKPFDLEYDISTAQIQSYIDSYMQEPK